MESEGMQPTEIAAVYERLIEQTATIIVGQEDTLRLLFVALLAEGHVLLEGPPGVAKTLLARTFSKGLDLEFGRIQFTPDMMPGDILGTNIYDFQSSSFQLTRGPIFTEMLLADEINRTPPKTQAALLEAMEERSITIDRTRHALGAGFMVIATQNPIEQEGTYPLPEAQLDRFLFKLLVGYPSREEEIALVAKHGRHRGTIEERLAGLQAIASLQFLESARRTISAFHLNDDMLAYIVDLVRATREHPAIIAGGSPRAASRLAAAAKAHALLAGRDFVIPDDVKQLFVPAMRHRLVLSPTAEIENLGPEQVIAQVIEQVAAPR